MYLLAVVGPIAMALIAILAGPALSRLIAQRWSQLDQSWLLATVIMVAMVVGIVLLNLINVIQQEKQHSLFVTTHQAIYYELIKPKPDGGLDFVMYCTAPAIGKELKVLQKQGIKATKTTIVAWLDEKGSILIPDIHKGQVCVT